MSAKKKWIQNIMDEKQKGKEMTLQRNLNLIFYNLMWEGENYFDKKQNYIQKPSQRNSI